ncbi:uncharacterized protein [Diabrotica undecimpunctata]|uniref:uncharacterized protein isoform X3 n=1 Tax=Diabrotica undecimpunctata TaxID=50387 RepID=UPI003B63349C
MAPSPENDNTPKAPDKSDKSKSERIATSDNTKENDKDEKTLSNLNDGELKALLDEAINYKNPKDREGKSKLFKDLLIQAEETERIARATSAGGSEEARHYNPSAARRHHGRHSAGADGGSGSGGHHGGRRHHDRHRKPSSISENMMHGGSLDNLAKEELFLESRQCLIPKMKTVSTRQREGGSLPCDVNSSVINPNIHSFIKEVKKSQAAIKDKEYTTADIETDSENQRLLDNDVLGQNYQESQEITIVPRFTTKATLQIAATPVDEPISFDLDTIADSKKPPELVDPNKVLHSKYSVFFPTYRSTEDRKVDENGNALHQNTNTKTKKKKAQTDKNVVVLTAESVEGHRSDIINDVDKLIQYIGGDKTDTPSGKSSKSNVHKSKQLHKQHASEDSGRGSSGSCKKQRAHSSKGKESRSEIKKSNSLGEISTAKLDDFTFAAPENDDENKVVLRGNKYQSDRPKERRSWGNVEILHSNEKESIQFNAQMLPPNIPDVQTIEKMHFMNCHPQQQQPQHIPSPIVVTQHVPRTNHPHPVTQSESTQTCTEVVTSLPSNKNKVDCDKSDRTMVSDSNSNKGEGGEDERPPPVVILSGIGNKEVTGLVFGFDVNEQLLQDDVCNNFVARFVAPEGYTHVSHNHDKIVNFIGSAWEAIINQPNGKVKYYMEES